MFEIECETCNTTKSNFKDFKQINEDLYAVEMSKTHSKYEKPIYVGCAVLDVSKTIMYEFFYDVTKPLYGDKLKLMIFTKILKQMPN